MLCVCRAAALHFNDAEAREAHFNCSPSLRETIARRSLVLNHLDDV